MAIGDTIFILTPRNASPPGSSFATQDTIADASSPTMITDVMDFDGAADEHMDWRLQVPSQYDGGGFTFSYQYAVDGTDVDIVEMEFRMIKLPDLDILTADLGIDTQTAVAIQDTPAATPTNKLNVTGTSNLSHANADSPAIADWVNIRGTRDISAATNTDDLQLGTVYVKET